MFMFCIARHILNIQFICLLQLIWDNQLFYSKKRIYYRFFSQFQCLMTCSDACNYINKHVFHTFDANQLRQLAKWQHIILFTASKWRFFCCWKIGLFFCIKIIFFYICIKVLLQNYSNNILKSQLTTSILKKQDFRWNPWTNQKQLPTQNRHSFTLFMFIVHQQVAACHEIYLKRKFGRATCGNRYWSYVIYFVMAACHFWPLVSICSGWGK